MAAQQKNSRKKIRAIKRNRRRFCRSALKNWFQQPKSAHFIYKNISLEFFLRIASIFDDNNNNNNELKDTQIEIVYIRFGHSMLSSALFE